MHEVFQIEENVGFIGKLAATSDLVSAQHIARDFAAIAWPNLELQWVDEYQLMDHPGGCVYIRIHVIRVDDTSAILHILREIISAGGFKFSKFPSGRERLQVKP